MLFVFQRNMLINTNSRVFYFGIKRNSTILNIKQIPKETLNGVTFDKVFKHRGTQLINKMTDSPLDSRLHKKSEKMTSILK